jgi:tRNA pseudouridine55 synthase
MSEGQIILINKPYDWTSFDVVKYIRKAIPPLSFGEGSGVRPKVGHAGTLDPLATGLLVLCTGAMTKKITEIQDSEKEYTGSFTLGGTTASYDMETEVSEEKDISHITKELIHQTTQQFAGEVFQTPPSHSAAKVKGRRAYAMARNGEAVELTPKKITIRKFEITEIKLPKIFFRIVCSKGTYIRSIANDFGKALGCGAYLSSLCRVRIGNFHISNSVAPKDFTVGSKVQAAS